MNEDVKSYIIIMLLLAIGFAAGLFVGTRARGEAEEQAQRAIEQLKKVNQRNSIIESRLKAARDTARRLNRELKKVRNGLEYIREYNQELEKRNQELREENRRQREIVAKLTSGVTGSLERVRRIERIAEESGKTVQECLTIISN